MPGEYEDIGGGLPRPASLLTVLHGQGPAIQAPTIAGFQMVAMGAQSGGPVAGAGPGFWTDHRSDCVIVAAMQHNGLGGWMSYYFTHLNGGLWTPAEQGLFNLAITNPLRTLIAMDSNTFAGMGALFDQINQGNPAGAIPAGNLLRYRTPNPTFALRLSDSAIGQRP